MDRETQTQEQTAYVIKIVDNINPIRITLPIMPQRLESSGSAQVVVVDHFGFVARQQISTKGYNIINPIGEHVKILFNNGFGCFDQTGRQTRVLEIAHASTEFADGVLNVIQKSWGLLGGVDEFDWSTGHELEVGFVDINENPINFTSTGIDARYTLIIQIQLL